MPGSASRIERLAGVGRQAPVPAASSRASGASRVVGRCAAVSRRRVTIEQHLVGHQAAAVRDAGDGGQGAIGREEPHRAAQRRSPPPPPPRRSHPPDPAAVGDDALFRSGQGHGRQVVEAGSGRQQEPGQPLLGRCRPHVVERVSVGQGERARRGAAQRPEIARAADGLPRDRARAPGRRCRPSRRRRAPRSGARGRVSSHPTSAELVEGHRARACSSGVSPGRPARRPAGRRPCAPRTPAAAARARRRKPASAASTASRVGGRPSAGRQLALEVVGRRAAPKTTVARYALRAPRWNSTTRVPRPR